MFVYENNFSSGPVESWCFYSFLIDTGVEQENVSYSISTALKFSRAPILDYLLKIE